MTSDKAASFGRQGGGVAHPSAGSVEEAADRGAELRASGAMGVAEGFLFEDPPQAPDQVRVGRKAANGRAARGCPGDQATTAARRQAALSSTRRARSLAASRQSRSGPAGVPSRAVCRSGRSAPSQSRTALAVRQSRREFRGQFPRLHLARNRCMTGIAQALDPSTALRRMKLPCWRTASASMNNASAACRPAVIGQQQRVHPPMRRAVRLATHPRPEINPVRRRQQRISHEPQRISPARGEASRCQRSPGSFDLTIGLSGVGLVVSDRRQAALRIFRPASGLVSTKVCIGVLA